LDEEKEKKHLRENWRGSKSVRWVKFWAILWENQRGTKSINYNAWVYFLRIMIFIAKMNFVKHSEQCKFTQFYLHPSHVFRKIGVESLTSVLQKQHVCIHDSRDTSHSRYIAILINKTISFSLVSSCCILLKWNIMFIRKVTNKTQVDQIKRIFWIWFISSECM
jgi:hypothetical protein